MKENLKITPEIRRAVLQENGKKGGTRTKKLYSIEHYKKIGKKGLEIRWGKKSK